VEGVLDAGWDGQQRAGLGHEVLVADAEAAAAFHDQVDLLLVVRALLVLVAAAEPVDSGAELPRAQHL
jgi:hypothetical protein